MAARGARGDVPQTVDKPHQILLDRPFLSGCRGRLEARLVSPERADPDGYRRAGLNERSAAPPRRDEDGQLPVRGASSSLAGQAHVPGASRNLEIASENLPTPAAAVIP